jgi:predicted nucleotidyltransferase
MKHSEILEGLVAEADRDQNVLGLLLFGSVMRGTQREDSDIDVITVYQSHKPTSGVDNTTNEGIKVGNIYLTYDVLKHSVETVPYLLHPVGEAKLLLDRDNQVKPQLTKIGQYFAGHPEIVNEWLGYYQLLKEEKAQYGYEKTTIVDVWNALEKRYSSGKIRRQFFNAFYMTNPLIFNLLKKLM